MTKEPIKTSTIVAAFAKIGVPSHELRVLALGANFDEIVVPGSKAELLRDSWSRIQRGENRIEAFWWVNGIGLKIEEGFL